MLKHVLVPLDGSVLAETALEYAKQLVPVGCKITLVLVIQPAEFPIYDFYPVPTVVIHEHDTSVNEATPFARDYLDRVAAPMRDQMGINVTTRIENGDPATVIVDVAKRIKADAIVMSTHGRTGWKGWLFGSVTQKVLAAASCPILVIPNFRRLENQDLPAETAVKA